VVVIDASVAVKWFVAEPDSAAARRIAVGEDLAAPEWLKLEVAHALDRRRRAGTVTMAECRGAVRQLKEVVRLFPAPPLVEPGQELAAMYDLTVYDAVYLALGLQMDAPVLTADRALARAPGVRLLSDMSRAN
jgi:predicted nucleic acid-binding protein